MLRNLMIVLTSVVFLSNTPVTLAQGTSSTPPALTDSSFSVEQIRSALAGAGFQVDEPIAWSWASPQVSALRVRDVATGRALMVLVYPNASAAMSARERGPHLVLGYGESVWIGNTAVVASTHSELSRLDQMLTDNDNGLYVSAEHLHQASQPHIAVDTDILQALTSSVVNL